MKLVRNEKRTQLRNNTLEAILIIWSFFKDKTQANKGIKTKGLEGKEVGLISEKMLRNYDEVVEKFNQKKSIN